MRGVLDYRNAVSARELFNAKDKQAAFEAFKQRPELLRLLSRMQRAQNGLPLDVEDAEREGAAIIDRYREEEDSD